MLTAPRRCQTLGERNEVSKVRTRAERARYAGDYGHPRLRITAEPPPCRAQLGKVEEVERIPPLGSIDDDVDDVMLVELVVYGHRTSMQALPHVTPQADPVGVSYPEAHCAS